MGRTAGEEMDTVTQSIDLPRGELRIEQPAEAAELPDSGGVEWAPLVPYWAVLWRSGVALARELDSMELSGRRVVELGCGLAVPSIAAARESAEVLATDTDEEALEFAERNASANGVSLETARVDWSSPDDLLARGPFDLAIAADVLYERQAVAQLLDLLPRLAPRAWVADPGRPAAEAFMELAKSRGRLTEMRVRGVVRLYGLSSVRPHGPPGDPGS
ncbi:MAG TPA: 50S ribosomal protein L11 methyltransferase [Thermoleophilaceae bacterium]|nr:50S ribosomal protein L11 methyltransferase [Thermoleophilaceae bacterium]